MSEIVAGPPALRCPTCGANQNWSDTCRRCRCDLRLLLAALRQGRRLRRRCLEQLRDQRYDEAAETARQCCRLDASPECRRLLAVTELMRGRFAIAVRLSKP